MINTFNSTLEKLKERTQKIKEYVDMLTSQKDKNTQKLFLSPLSYNAVIISLYSCYENYIDDILSEYINQVLNRSNGHDEIPLKIKIFNLTLSADFLNSEQRFKNLNLNREDVINNIYSGKVTNNLLLKHAGNLSYSVLSEYLNNFEITGIGNKIKETSCFIEYYASQKDISIEKAEDLLRKTDLNNVFSCLEQLISQRNIIAHSWKSDDRVGYEIIRDVWIPFIDSFCGSIHKVIITNYAEWLVKNNKLLKAANYQIYGSSVVGFKELELDIKKGDSIIVYRNKCIVCKINDVRKVDGTSFSIEIEGIKLKIDKEEQYTFYFLK